MGLTLKKEWTREDLIKAVPIEEDRRELAKTDRLIFCLEYQPLIRLPNTGEIIFEPYYAQQVVLKDDSRWRIINKMRQGGFTTAFAAVEAVHDMIYGKATEIICLSKSQDDAINFLDKFYLAYKSVKDKVPDCPELIITNTKNAKNMIEGKIKVLTSSKNSGRSYSATKFYMDEMAYIAYAQSIYNASYPTISRTGGGITGFSTPDGKSGLFYKICDNYQDMGYSYHQFEWWFVPFYNPNYKEFIAAHLSGDKEGVKVAIAKARTGTWYKQTLAAMGDLAFMREYECSFDAGEDSVFNTRQLANTFRKNWLTQKFEEYGEVWRDPEYELRDGLYYRRDQKRGEDRHSFVTYSDYGRKRDPLVCVTFDFTLYPAQLVEYKRIRPTVFDFAEVKKSIIETIKNFNSDGFHDGLGNGDVLTAFLEGYSSPVIYGDSGISKKKTNMVEKLKIACDTKAIMIPKIAQIHKEFKGYKYADKNIVQDTVMAIGGAVDQFFEPAADIPTVDSQFSYLQG